MKCVYSRTLVSFVTKLDRITSHFVVILFLFYFYIAPKRNPTRFLNDRQIDKHMNRLAARPTFSQILSLKIHRSTFLNNVKLVDWRILRLWKEWKGRSGGWQTNRQTDGQTAPITFNFRSAPSLIGSFPLGLSKRKQTYIHPQKQYCPNEELTWVCHYFCTVVKKC